MNNQLLSDCAVQRVCDYLPVPIGMFEISGNNPGCDSPEAVEDACLKISVDEFVGNREISISPNPVFNNAFLSLNNHSKSSVEVCFYNTIGICLKSGHFNVEQADEQSYNPGLASL